MNGKHPIHQDRPAPAWAETAEVEHDTLSSFTSVKGRGAISNTTGRHEDWSRTRVDDGWDIPEERSSPAPHTTLTCDTSRSIITYNKSPDIPFDRSINPYRGCEHGCIYCYARPSHAWLGLSPGLDFETRLLYKPDAPKFLRRELENRRYQCAPIALGANTDPYQPVERKLELTRQILEVLEQYSHPVMIVTKSGMVERDIDLLAPMANRGLASVAISLTTLQRDLARKMEPRAVAPERRLQTIASLTDAKIPVTTLVAPVIPALTDSELETILRRASEAGSRSAAYVLLRLPLEISDLFQEWLATHFPLKKDHVMNRVRDMRGGKDYDATFGTRMRGSGQFAELIATRFDLACQRLGFVGQVALDCSQFRPPSKVSDQLALF